MTDHHLRITGGHLKGRKLAVQKDGRARYTSSKVRKAIFDILGEVEDFDILDLFGGSGSFTAEALSRDAKAATVVEKDGGMARLLESNLSNLSLYKRCLVLHMDVRYAVRRLAREGRSYDLVFLDPPYQVDLVKETIAALSRYRILRKGGLIVVEHSKREPIETIPKTWHLEKQRTYGDTVISVMRYAADDDAARGEV
jgi:16S rRNA (guanine966-N2)-methyltransferase